jgi:Sigma-70 region 2
MKELSRKIDGAVSQMSRQQVKHRPSRKRNRCCVILVVFAAAATSLMSLAQCYVPVSKSSVSLTFMKARAAVEDVVTPLTPKSSGNTKRRNEAVKAMKRTKVETALQGVDAQMLQLLSNQFLYPENQLSEQTRASRPRGRPDFVPGAMKFETMLKFQQQFGAIGASKDPRADTVEISQNKISEESAKKQGRVRGTLLAADELESLPETIPMQRKRVVKNLPKPRDPRSESPAPKRELKGRAKANNLELQKYYSTELLTTEEEYSLGMQIQLLVKCEQVHEGLAVEMMRLPTIEEWAHACGYVQEDNDSSYQEGLEQIRPAGAELMFEEVDPNMFVGNGLAQDAGPGRGRGRVKKPPPTKLKDFFDKKREGIKKKEPINRGTTLDFVDMMMDGREAKQRMVQSNMRLVISIARKYSNVGVGLQDLVQEGSLGLSRAAEKFDPSKGFKFSTYASW